MVLPLIWQPSRQVPSKIQARIKGLHVSYENASIFPSSPFRDLATVALDKRKRVVWTVPVSV